MAQELTILSYVHENVKKLDSADQRVNVKML